jgi:hypothetical protein
MPRPFTPRQEAANAAFLAALARTGNTRLAARELGVHRSTYFKRRAKSKSFAAAWDAALTTAHRSLKNSSPGFPGEGDRAQRGGGAGRRPNLKTEGGEPLIIRQKSGRLQLRQALPGRITAAAEQLFFRTLSATANIRFAAEAAGFAHTSFLYRKRRSRRFAAEARRSIVRAQAAMARAAAAATRAHLAHLRAHPPTGWPAELTVARALRVLRSPPLKLPCTPFPKKRRP